MPIPAADTSGIEEATVYSPLVSIATSEAVNVFYDMTTRRSTEPPADVRALLESELASPGVVG